MAAPVMTFGQRQQAMVGLPFYGKSDFNFVASKSPFSNGIAIKLLPLADLSRVVPVKIDQFDQEVQEMTRHFKKGLRTSGIKVNSTFVNAKREPEIVIGRFDSFKVDKDTKTIRAFIQDPKTLKPVEIYPESLNRLNESKSHLAKTFLEFVI
jgi:hypothetical protein